MLATPDLRQIISHSESPVGFSNLLGKLAESNNHTALIILTKFRKDLIDAHPKTGDNFLGTSNALILSDFLLRIAKSDSVTANYMLGDQEILQLMLDPQPDPATTLIDLARKFTATAGYINDNLSSRLNAQQLETVKSLTVSVSD